MHGRQTRHRRVHGRLHRFPFRRHRSRPIGVLGFSCILDLSGAAIRFPPGATTVPVAHEILTVRSTPQLVDLVQGYVVCTLPRFDIIAGAGISL